MISPHPTFPFLAPALAALLLPASWLLASPDTAPAEPGYPAAIQAAREASAAGDWPALADALTGALHHRPYSAYLLKNLVIALELSGRRDEALSLLADHASRGLAMELTGHAALDRLRDAPGAETTRRAMRANLEPVGQAGLVASLPDRDLLPEAIAIASDGTLLVGSVRNGRILELAREGGPRIVATADGGVFDIEVRGDEIWAAVNNQLAWAGPEESRQAPFAAVQVFDAKTGKRLRQARVPGTDALFGDLEVADDGTAWVSDSKTPRLMVWRPDTDSLDEFTTDPRFVNLQGLALDADSGRMFVADYLAGIFSVDVATAAVDALANPSGAFLGGIDGLYRHGHDLVGIQNGTRPLRIVCMMLAPSGNAVEALQVVHRALPEWNEPTHGVVVDGELHYIATSNWPAYDDEWNPREEPAPQPLRVLRADLSTACARPN